MKLPAWAPVALKILISAGVLGVLVTQLNPARFQETLARISPWVLLWGTVLYLLAQGVSAWRWHVLTRAMGLRAPFSTVYRLYLLGMFLSLFLPTSIGGDLGRAMLFARETRSTWLRSFLSILAERGTGLVGLVVPALLGVLVFQPRQWLWPAMVLTGLLLAGLGFLFGFRWLERHSWSRLLIERFVLKRHPHAGEDPATLWPPPGAIGKALLISTGFHLGIVALHAGFLWELGAALPYGIIASIYGLGTLASMLPVSFNGIGLREGAMIILAVQWGMLSQDTAVAYSLLWLSILLLATLPGGLILLWQQLRGLTTSASAPSDSPE